MTLNVVYFSPIGSTLKVADYIAEGMDFQVTYVDLTDPVNRQNELVFSSDDIVLFVFPVYAGRLVRIPRYFFKRIKGNGGRAVSVVTYGNRAYDDALLELTMLVDQAGFLHLAAGAFVCEHAFDNGLATSRPDSKDALTARLFGQKIRANIDENKSYQNITSSIPGHYPFKTRFRHDFSGPLVPSTSDKCIVCGRCMEACPVSAIDQKNPKVTDSKTCITCFRCIRMCQKNARKIELSDFDDHASWLAENYKSRKEPDIFLP
ncbi:4Fe-4S dicluster domain-containing protein [Acidaminobacter sp. JC074]|uniref:EFR1 family ferrodoxin n=1 Tax=Acidaminobacter sp. JC074 TaxID=2530199 RepID=UPI001F11333D|nr:EFR1 family ferrodoxin [Acidaminobacter sp. JC074]MCH4891340.1 4Fe-4S dicluster domain-containing protein [Acidaminobacter sp. JC074]